MERKLYRSRSDRMVAGVCGGLAEYLSVDPTLVRVGTVLLGILTQGTVVIAYVIMAIVVPEEPVWAAPAVSPVVGGGVPMAESNEPHVQENGIPKAPDVTPGSQPASAPGSLPTTPVWTPPAPVERTRRGGVGFGIMLIVIGGVLLANQFVPDVNLWRFWPLLIIAAGVGALVKGVRR